MSVHSDKVDKHAIHTNLENVQNEISAISDIQGKTPEAVELLARISLVVKNLSTALETCSKELIAIAWLEEASRALVNLKSYLTSFKTNKDVNTLRNNSSSQLDVLLLTSTKLGAVKSNQRLKGITAVENEYARMANVYNEQLATRVKELEEEINGLKKVISQQETISQKSLQELENSISAEKKRLDGFATSYQNQMATDQNNFLSMSDSLKSTFTEAQAERKNTFISKMSELEGTANNVIDLYQKKFAKYEEQVTNIVGVINTNLFSHKYKEVADNAQKRAKTWHIVAMVLMILVSLFAVYAFIISVNKDTSWIKLVAKIFATTTLVTGAAYAARQASKQEKVERYARKIEMELVAIDPFIQSLEKEKQSVIKEEIARKIFGNSDAMEIGQKEEAYPTMDKLASIEKLLQSVLNVVGQISK